jgi:hypothetical protein
VDIINLYLPIFRYHGYNIGLLELEAENSLITNANMQTTNSGRFLIATWATLLPKFLCIRYNSFTVQLIIKKEKKRKMTCKKTKTHGKCKFSGKWTIFYPKKKKKKKKKKRG